MQSEKYPMFMRRRVALQMQYGVSVPPPPPASLHPAATWHYVCDKLQAMHFFDSVPLHILHRHVISMIDEAAAEQCAGGVHAATTEHHCSRCRLNVSDDQWASHVQSHIRGDREMAVSAAYDPSCPDYEGSHSHS